MIPLCVPNLCGNERAYLNECIDTTFVSTVGPFVSRFENMVAHAAGADAAFAASSGTCGLHLALRAVGTEAGDLVVLPSFTFIASANAVAHCGAVPWLFDIAPESWTLDPKLLANQLATETVRDGATLRHRDSGRRVAAILVVYTLGMPADMDAITAVAREWGIPVVADAAAALGATYKSRPISQLGAALSVFSFNGNKTVTSGGGGAVVGPAGPLVTLVRHLGSTARKGIDYSHDMVGFNYRMTNLQAAVGCAQMENLERFVAAKRAIAERYDRELVGVSGVGGFPQPDWAHSACWFSGIVLPTTGPSSASIRQGLSDAGIEARPFWKPMHLQQPYASAPHTPQPVAESLWERVVTLPCSTHLDSADQDKVIETLRGLLR